MKYQRVKANRVYRGWVKAAVVISKSYPTAPLLADTTPVRGVYAEKISLI